MHNILVLGAGRIGCLIACLLALEDYQVCIADTQIDHLSAEDFGNVGQKITQRTVDAMDAKQLKAAIKETQSVAVVSALPYFCNVSVAKVARECGIHYFDLTEDTAVTEAVSECAKSASHAFVPQCGIAPGFISIVANTLASHFDKLESLSLRVGALPVHPNAVLKYALTWSTEGLINEYGNLCHAILNGMEVSVQPLEGLEQIQIDGLAYEAFNTSGGLGSLVETYQGKVKNLTYKTLRYPGHCQQIRLLMNDLKFNEDRETLKQVLERALPRTVDDVVIVYVNVTGHQSGHFTQETFVRKLYPQKIANKKWSAIQVTTAASVCAVLDMVLHVPKKYQGFIRQEQFSLESFLKNRFGQYYGKGEA